MSQLFGTNSSEAAKQAAIRALSLINPADQPYGTTLFDALARVTVSIGIEPVCIRKNAATGRLEVLLTKRPADETIDPGVWHCPGSIIRPGEEFEDVFARLDEKEFKEKVVVKGLVGAFNYVKTMRGHTVCLVYLAEAEGKAGEWYPVDALPEPIFNYHRDQTVPAVVKFFMESR